MRKGIILAGGLGTRFYPATFTVSKQLLPIYDKPMIYYPLTTLMLAGIREILIITWAHETTLFQKLLGDGSKWGIKLTYGTQAMPRGIAEAFLIGKHFIGNDPVCLILGDNLLYGHGLASVVQHAAKEKEGAEIFAYYVHDPKRYGVITFDKNDKPVDIIEKPLQPSSNYAVVGLYFYDHQVIEIAESLRPSQRDELEITDINKIYLQANQLRVQKLGRGTAWLDTGTPESCLEASNFIQILEHRQGLKIGCPEEVAWRMNYISLNQLAKLGDAHIHSSYGKYLKTLALESKSENLLKTGNHIDA